MKRCTHKTWRDFTLPQKIAPVPREPTVRNAEGKIVIRVNLDAEPAPPPLQWRCSGCGVVDVWDAGWSCYGIPECRVCWVAAIESVSCPACNAKREAREAKPIESPTKSDLAKVQRAARVAAKLALAEAKVARLRAELKETRR